MNKNIEQLKLRRTFSGPAVCASITPDTAMHMLSQHEVEKLCDTSQGGLHEIFRNSALAVLTSGNETDDTKAIFSRYADFDIGLEQRDRGVKLELINAPASAFVDGEIIQGIKEHLFAVLRDIIYVHNEIQDNPKFDLETSDGITNAIFHILRNAEIIHSVEQPHLVVCWGGHSISDVEYRYTKEVGHQLGLRSMDICTGCGPGAMKGPMKGAAIAHAKQRIKKGRYLGVTEPTIIAAEAPNPIVNELVIMPDIEKRLEAFIRVGHGFFVFPGEAGTLEEILYLLGLLLHPNNVDVPFPLIFTGPKQSENYFRTIDAYIKQTLGAKAAQRYQIIIDNPQQGAYEMNAGIQHVREFRKQTRDAYYFNWHLTIDHEFQKPFKPTHESMAQLDLHADQPSHMLAANLRRAFSGVVAGNIRTQALNAIEKDGPFKIHGDSTIMKLMDELLQSFIEENRMKIDQQNYKPCYEIIA
ncbi:MAG: nucleotide 5'-monophosphate nucleosidase PpnN [Nitrospirales bacterium]